MYGATDPWEGWEVRRHRERLPRERFDRKIQRYRDDQRDRGREDDPHGASMSARMASMTAACRSHVPPAIGIPKLTVTRPGLYAGSPSCSNVAMR